MNAETISAQAPRLLLFGPLWLVEGRRSVTLPFGEARLTWGEYAALWTLAEQAPRLVRHELLLRAIHGAGSRPVKARDLLGVTMRGLARKLRECRSIEVLKVHGQGYLLRERRWPDAAGERERA